ncbi:MAG: hypothetical protein WD049_09110 [Candidatus Paceibacterota bacterium]
MNRKVVHLVRTTQRSESIEALIESPAGEPIESTEPAELWLYLTTNGIEPDCDEEVDAGIEAFVGEFEPRTHAALPAVDLSALKTSASSRLAQPNPLAVGRGTVPSQRRNTVRNVVTLKREIEQFEVKQLIVETSTTESIDTTLADTLWYRLPEIKAEVDEFYLLDCDVEAVSYDALHHRGLSFISLPAAAFEARTLPPEFLSGWQPSSSADEKDTVESKRVAMLLDAEPKQCYFNARRVLRSLPDYSDASYVEGCAVFHGSVTGEHGWLIKDGKIIDPSVLDEATLYFPGLEFSGRDQVRAFLQTERGRRCHGHPFHYAFGSFGRESTSFRQARDAAKNAVAYG